MALETPGGSFICLRAYLFQGFSTFSPFDFAGRACASPGEARVSSWSHYIYYVMQIASIFAGFLLLSLCGFFNTFGMSLWRFPENLKLGF